MNGFIAGIDVGGPAKGYHLAAWRTGSLQPECCAHLRSVAQAADWLAALQEQFQSPCLGVAIDGPPLALRQAGTPVRPAELALRRLGYRILWTPPADRPAQPWMEQSAALWRQLGSAGYRLFETFPTLNSDRLLPLCHSFPLQLLQDAKRRRYRPDYLDAVLCCLSAEAAVNGTAAVYGVDDPVGPIHTLPEPQMKKYTLAFICAEKRVLLGRKKRGFGAGYWNGFGGKVEPGESSEAAIRREVREECGLCVEQLESAGGLRFVFAGDPVWMDVQLFRVLDWSGQVQESEEMAPAWFDRDSLPFDKMWADDRFWLPQLLTGRTVSGDFYFSDLRTLHRWNVTFE